MDWNAKWDWESFATFGSKATESPKKLQLVDWTIINDGEIDAGSFNLSSGSDGGHVSSAKSSISASESSTKEGMQTPDFRLMTSEELSGNFSKKMEASIGSIEPFIGLKLGKRTYFENSGAGSNVKSASLSVMPTPLKKTKSAGQNLHIPRCVVEGCDFDLSMAKEYHRKHKVCDIHSKSPKVIVGGHERRFCQQCSRFHNLSEFDEKKRSCRRRLSDHNARRRKPQQETIHFSSTRLSSPLYGGRQQMSFLLNNTQLIHSNTTWDSTSNSKFTLTKGFPSKCIGDGVSNEQMHIPGVKLPHLINVQCGSAKGLLESKSSMTEVWNPGSKGSQFASSHLDAAPEYGRALSLLSSNSWGTPPMPLNPAHENSSCITQAMIHGVPEGGPLSSSEFWLSGQQSTTIPRLATNSNFQEIQLCITPYDTDLFPSMLN